MGIIMNRKSIILIQIIFICVFGSTVNGESQNKKWEAKACSDLYRSIGLFAHLADKNWQEKNEKRAAFYASVASDYAIIYRTVCDSE